jgi:hypothetical protein
MPILEKAKNKKRSLELWRYMTQLDVNALNLIRAVSFEIV